MKILLILPSAKHLRVSKSGRIPKRNMLRFSILPLLSVAALTPKEHEVCIFDENVEPIDWDTDADVIGISFMTALAPRAYEISCEFRRNGKITVAGGYHPTLLPDEVVEHFDSAIIGDAEKLWPELLKDIENSVIKKRYCNEEPPDLSDTPVPSRELMKNTAKYYATVNAVQAGRGCPHGCSYCSVTAFHKQTHRSRPVVNVINEIKSIKGNFIFVDDNIIADEDYARELFKRMIPFKKRWVSQCSIRIADDRELLDLAYKAGCRGLFIGIETISEKNLSNVQKGFNDSRGYKERIKIIRQKGIGIIAGMIVGMDDDDPGVFERILKFLQKVGIDALQLNIMTPLPGTPLFMDFDSKGRISDYDWSNYDFRHVVIKPAKMSQTELQEGADWLYSQFYRLDRILTRAVRTFFEVGPLSAFLSLKLNLTYRYDNIRECIRGRNPAKQQAKEYVLKKKHSVSYNYS